jgi:hypothetical protein
VSGVAKPKLRSGGWDLRPAAHPAVEPVAMLSDDAKFVRIPIIMLSADYAPATGLTPPGTICELCEARN